MFEFLQAIAEWVQNGIYGFFVEACVYLFESLFLWWLDAQIFMIGFCWDIAHGILSSLHVSEAISNAWSELDSDMLQAALFFRVPEALNLLLSAGVTRLVMGFLPI